MSDLPAWLQEIRDRAEAATPGPWRVVAHGEQDCLARREITAGKHIMIAMVDCVPGVAADFDRDYAFIAHARTDVPRLVELVAEMAWNLRNVTDQVQDACRSRMTPLSQCPEPSDDYCPTCPTGLRGECGAPRSLEALRKFRGEVSSND
jgi:hypothetical protein